MELDLLPTHPWRLWLHLAGLALPLKGGREDSRQPGCCEGENTDRLQRVVGNSLVQRGCSYNSLWVDLINATD